MFTEEDLDLDYEIADENFYNKISYTEFHKQLAIAEDELRKTQMIKKH